MHPPKAVIFDLGKVLLEFDFSIAAQHLSQHADLSQEEITHAINQSPLLHRYETGLLTTEEFFQTLRREIGFRGDRATFDPLFAAIFAPIPEMIRFQQTLRQQQIPTYIFSNTNELAIHHIQSHYPFFNDFDGHILSYQHQSMKPHPKLYEVVEHQSGFSGPDLLYLDDRAENIEASLQRGWNGLLHQTPSQTLERLKPLFPWVSIA